MSNLQKIQHKMRFAPVLFWITATYVLSLLLSWGFILISDTPNLPHKYQHIVEIQNNEQLADENYDQNPRISYYKFGEEQTGNAPVLLLHDNLYSAEYLVNLALELKEQGFQVIIPDQPGYGFTTYPAAQDFRSKSKSIIMLLDYLEITDFHLLAHADAGPLAFYLSDEIQREAESIILLSASGVEELKMLGNHTLNRSLLLLQFPAYWFVEYLVPHFGWLYHTPYQYTTIVATYEVDFRPVREMMLKFENPVQIIHGEHDNYIPVQSAEEHHRLLPQSEFHLLDDDHQLFQNNLDAVTDLITDFLRKTTDGRGTTRGAASQERVELSKKPFDADQTASLTGISLMVLLTFLALTTLVSEDIACIGAGLLAAKGIIGIFPALAACITGILIADITIYWLGRWIGSPMLRWIPFRWFIDEEDVRNAENLFKESGLAIIFVSRFLPGTRFPTYFSAGMVRAKFTLFLIYFIMAILIWAPLIFGLSMLIGQTMLDYFDVYQEYALWMFIGLVIAILLIVKYMVPLATQSGRRMVNARIERLKRKWL